MRKQKLSIIVAVGLFGLLLLGALGCYETETPLGSPDTAIVSKAYVGDFLFTDKDNKSTSIVIRNIDNKLYYVEWTDNSEKDKGPTRMIGYTADVKGVTFANLRELSDDGTVPTKYLVERISLSADGTELTLRGLDDKFFADKKVDTQAGLSKVIEDNLDNQAMYDGAPLTGTRVPIPAH